MTPVEALTPALLRIYGAGGHAVGVGFLVGPRQALTCDHVVEAAGGPQAHSVRLDFPLLAPGRILTATLLRRDAEADIAVLNLAGDLPPGACPVSLKEAADLWGHPFRAFGFPAAHPDGVWASGVIRGPTARGWLQIEDVQGTGYRVQAGFSGSPVWDDRLDGVVGMVTHVETDPAVRAAFVIPAAALRAAYSPFGGSAPASLPPNPFTDTLAVKDPSRFVGRERVLERILSRLRTSSIVLFGERKIGKSSLLWQLKRLLEPKWEVVFWDFLEPRLADGLLREAIALLGGKGEKWEDFRRAVGGRQVALLLDELDLAPDRGFDLDMLRGCRALCQRESGFRLIAASRRLPRDIFPPPRVGSTPWDFLEPVEVPVFTEEEARRLLAHPWAPEAPQFDEATCQTLITLTGCHPFRLQRAAHHRYEALADPTYDWRAAYERDMEALG